jgi:hypothetical protein
LKGDLYVLLDVFDKAELAEHFDIFLLNVGHFYCLGARNGAFEYVLLFRLSDLLVLEKKQILVIVVVGNADLQGSFIGGLIEDVILFNLSVDCFPG